MFNYFYFPTSDTIACGYKDVLGDVPSDTSSDVGADVRLEFEDHDNQPINMYKLSLPETNVYVLTYTLVYVIVLKMYCHFSKFYTIINEHKLNTNHISVPKSLFSQPFRNTSRATLVMDFLEVHPFYSCIFIR